MSISPARRSPFRKIANLLVSCNTAQKRPHIERNQRPKRQHSIASNICSHAHHARAMPYTFMCWNSERTHVADRLAACEPALVRCFACRPFKLPATFCVGMCISMRNAIPNILFVPKGFVSPSRRKIVCVCEYQQTPNCITCPPKGQLLLLLLLRLAENNPMLECLWVKFRRNRFACSFS